MFSIVKKFILLNVLLSAFMLTSFANAEIVENYTHSSLDEYPCDGGIFNQVMYAGTDGHELVDTLTSDNGSYDWQIRSTGSKLPNYSWYSLYNVIPNAITIPTLEFLSQVKPHNVSTVVVMGTRNGGKVTSSIPSSYKRSQVAAQVVYYVYRIGYKYKAGEPGSQVLKYLDYNKRNNSDWGTEYYDFAKTGTPSPKGDYECLNIHIGYCGDGIVDNGTVDYSEDINDPLDGGEECDDGDKNGTASSSCSSSCKLQALECGEANNTVVTSEPTSAKKCKEGSSVKAGSSETTSTEYKWKCEKGSQVVSCSAKRNAECGEAHNTTVESEPTSAKKCKEGSSVKAGSSKTTDGGYEWKCERGSQVVSCSATKKKAEDPKCGTAHNTNRDSKPDTNELKCSDGTPGTVETDKTNYKWKWTCKKGSKTVNCEAKMIKPECGEANNTTVESEPTSAKKCKEGSSVKKGSSKTTDDGYEWKCVRGDENLEVSCSATKKKAEDPKCGTAHNTNRDSKPDTNELKCSDGTPGTVETDKTNYKWKWTCKKGSKTVNCEAKMIKPECGAAHNTTVESEPTNAKKCKEGSTVKEGSSKLTDNGYEWKCVRGDENLEVKCLATKKDEDSPYIDIEEKVVLGEKTTFDIGEKVSFKVTFKNNSAKTVEKAIVRDIFPLNLKYQSSSISLEGAKSKYYEKDGNHIIEFSGFSMKSGESGYLIFTGEVTENYLTNTSNCAYSYRKVGETAVSYKCSSPYLVKKSIFVDKRVVSTAEKVSNGDQIDYEVKIISYGGITTGVIIEDTLPNGVKYLDNPGYSIYTKIEGKQPEVFENNGNKLVWTIKFPSFKKGDEITLKYSVKVNNDSEDTSYVNNACVYDMDENSLGCNGAKIDKDLGGVKVHKSLSKSSDFNGDWKESLTINASNPDRIIYFRIDVKGVSGKLQSFKIVDKYDQDTFKVVMQGDKFNYNDYITNKSDESDFGSTGDVKEGKIEWTVKMKKGSFSKDNVYSLIFPMELIATSGGNIACVVDPDSCSNEAKFKIEPDPIPDCIQLGTCPEPVCGDGKQEGIEYCDWEGENHIIEGGKLFKYEGVYNEKYNNWRCTSDCQLVSGSVEPACFNVQNGSISIMTGEILPFYRNVEGMLGNRNETARRNYLQRNFYSSEVDGACDETNVYKIDLNSLKCKFFVYGPSVRGSKDSVYELEDVDCVKVNGWGDGDDVEANYYDGIKEYIKQNWSGWFAGSVGSFEGSDEVKNVFKTLNNWKDYPTLFPVSSKLVINNFGNMGGSDVLGINRTIYPKHEITNFGEYKVSLDKISYKYCDFHQDSKGKNNFYMTEGNNERVCEVDFALTNHYLVQKSPYGYVDEETRKNLKSYHLKNGGPLFVIDTGDVKVDNYQMMSNVSENFDTFISKYDRIAKGDGDLRQVPGKLIFVTDLEKGQEFNLSDKIPSSVLSSRKPFTLIASKGADIVISDNFLQNMMIITQGRIIFDAENACNTQGNGFNKYSKAGQIVQGIFYAGDGFDSINDKLNDNVKNKYRCNYGNLHIKGVVLGDLIDVKSKRRSELYTWFNSDDFKREIVLNGASVMIEFNSNLLSSDIPGVSEFNNLLVTQRE